MATRMQQRKGTAAQWTGANPILNAGEIGWESDTNQFKIGDGTNHWDDLPYFVDETSITTQLGDYVETSQLGVANGVATLNSSGKLESSQVPNIDELAQDAVDSALVAGTGISKSYNDNANTITISVDTSVIATKAELAEVSQDSINDALTAGAGIHKAYDDNANTLTISVDSTVVKLSDSQTLLNKTINLANNTITGTLDQFNSAMSDGNFASTAELSYAVEYHSNALTAVHGVGGNVVGTSDTQTITNKTINLANNTVTGTLADFNAAISDDNILPVSGGTMTGALTLSGSPTQDLHAATKAYVDGVSQGLHIHASVKVATTANLNISTDLEPGDTVDGVTLAEGDRVLVKSQTNSAQNGIYVVQSSGAALRASDFNEPQEVDGGDFVFVNSGTLYADTGWVQVTDNVVTIGTDPIVFTQFSGAGTYAAGTGLVLNGNQFAIGNTVVTTSDAQSLSSKSISLGTNTLTGNISQFNEALTDADFSTLAGTETLTNKTISVSGNNIITITSDNVVDFSLASRNAIGTYVTANDGVENVFDNLSNTFVLSVDDSVVRLTGTQSLSGKTINLANNTISTTFSQLNTAVSDADLVSTSSTDTLTNKTIGLSNNTITGTLAQFNTALSDADFATLAGSETLTNKSINLANNTITGTLAQFNDALDGASFVTMDGPEGLTNKVISLANNTISGTISDFNTALTDGTFVTEAGIESLLNKTIDLANNTITGTVSQFNTALSDGNFATLAGSESLTNKSIDLGNNTVTGTIAQFNSALADGNFTTLAGAETLLNKTLNLSNNTVIGTIAEFNGVLSDADFATIAGDETLFNKTLNLSNNTITGTVSQFNDALSDGNFATVSGSEALHNKTIDLTNNTVVGTILQFNTALSDADFATLAGSETLTNKTISLTNNTVQGTIAQFNTALIDGDFVTQQGPETIVNKTVDLANNTVTGTIAQFNTALSDADFATLAGSETLTNKTISLTNNTVQGTIAQFNTALIDGDFVTQQGAETLANKTIDSANNTITITSANMSDFVEATVDKAANALTSATHTNITVTYNDNDGTIALSGSSQYSDEMAQDAIGNALGSGLTYNDNTGAISVDTTTIQARVANVSDTEIGYLDGVTSAIQTQLNAKLDKSGGTMTGAITLSGAPTDPLHAANKGYVDAAVEGLHVHPSVKAATTANITLASAVENGDTLDGVTLATGDRILVKNQSTPSENGIYIVSASGAPTRATDFDTAAEVDSGDFVFVDSGTINGNTGWVQINTPATIGTDAIEFVQFSGAGTYTASGGITLTGNQFTITNSAVGTFAATPSSANLAAAVTDETGSGALVFGTSPTLVTPRVQLAMNAQTGTTYTPVLSDASNRLVTCDNASAITVTIPPSVFSTGDSVLIQQTGAGQVTFAQGSGVTITSAGATIAAPKIRTRYSSATVICTGSNTFTIIGDIV